jgi:hypothetical protein
MASISAYDVLKLSSKTLTKDEESGIFYNSMGVPLQHLVEDNYVVLESEAKPLAKKEIDNLVRICCNNGFVSNPAEAAKALEVIAQESAARKQNYDQSVFRVFMKGLFGKQSGPYN